MISVLFICIIALSSSSGKATQSFSQKQAEKLIRGLNLFPKLDVNIVQDDHPSVAAEDVPSLVETTFRFPYFDANSSDVTVEELGHHAGYYKLAHTKGASMFYFFFESRNKNASAPVVIWLTGGPGCSSSLAMFFENGPFKMNPDLSLLWNDYGWDQASNLIYIDQPTGTGFSFTTVTADLRHSTAEAGADFYDFLQAFFQKHPELVNNDFYITGESYAGHYIPAFAAQILQNNKNKAGIHINLKGLAIGNGLTNPAIQYPAYPDFALDNKLIDRAQYDSLNQIVPVCQDQIKACWANNSKDACNEARETCESIFTDIVDANSGINYYDIRTNCVGTLCYDFLSAETFLNEKEVQKALGVNDIYFVSCSSVVYSLMSSDWMKNFELPLPAMLKDGIEILIYAGEYDLICNWLGNSRWVEAMEWSGQKQFVAAPSVAFKVGGVDAGMRKNYGGLTFLKVYNAGHMVPMDQPKASLEMLRRWMHGQSL